MERKSEKSKRACSSIRDFRVDPEYYKDISEIADKSYEGTATEKSGQKVINKKLQRCLRIMSTAEFTIQFYDAGTGVSKILATVQKSFKSVHFKKFHEDMMNDAVHWFGIFCLTSKVIDFPRFKKLANIYRRQILRFVHQCYHELEGTLINSGRTLAIYSENMAGFHYFLMEAQQPFAMIEMYTNMLFERHVQEVIPHILSSWSIFSSLKKLLLPNRTSSIRVQL